MTLLRLVIHELLRMFVEADAALPTLILICAVTGLVLLTPLPSLWGAGLLLVGCVVILAGTVTRAARRR